MRATRALTTLKLNQRVINPQVCISRGYASSRTAQVLRYTQHGTPKSVLKLETEELPSKLADDQVLVKMVAAPINPADINMIEGVYGKKANLPAVGGNEGVGVVVEAGPKSNFKANQHVIPTVAGLGTWRTHGVFKHNQLLAVPEGVKPEHAATISVNPATALRLLSDFADLKEGDVIIQNGANSAAGLAVIQLAKLKGIKTINVVRDRPNFADLHDKLSQMGAHAVVTEEYLATAQFRRMLGDIAAPKLALNCVGGKSATEIARTLAPNGTIVTYGGMSRKPVTIPTSLFIFKNIQSRGFWLTKWSEENPEKAKAAYKELFDLVQKGHLKISAEKRGFKEWEGAIEDNGKDFRDRKLILHFD